VRALRRNDAWRSTGLELDEALARAPVFAETLAAVRLAASRGAEQRILSDANDRFISVILRARALDRLFSRVVTNGTRLEAASADAAAAAAAPTTVLRVLPHTPPERPHGCARCPPNLCKGAIVDAWRAEPPPPPPPPPSPRARRRWWGGGAPPVEISAAAARRIVYVGDGGGDVCAALRLGTRDVVCARDGWSLHKGLQRAAAPRTEARVLPWRDGAELLAHFEALFAPESP